MTSTPIPALVLGIDNQRTVTVCEGSLLGNLGIDSASLIVQPLSTFDGAVSALLDVIDRTFATGTQIEQLELAGALCQVVCFAVRSTNGTVQGVTLVAEEEPLQVKSVQTANRADQVVA